MNTNPLTMTLTDFAVEMLNEMGMTATPDSVVRDGRRYTCSEASMSLLGSLAKYRLFAPCALTDNEVEVAVGRWFDLHTTEAT